MDGYHTHSLSRENRILKNECLLRIAHHTEMRIECAEYLLSKLMRLARLEKA